jgi:hypothetical protein
MKNLGFQTYVDVGREGVLAQYLEGKRTTREALMASSKARIS